MENKAQNTKTANQIYLFGNVLNMLFMVYIIARSLNMLGLLGLTKGIYLWILLGFILSINIINAYAKKKGGIGNPIRTYKKARVFHVLSIAFFLFGIFAVAVFRWDKDLIFTTLLGIPLDIYAIYLAYNVAKVKEETDLIDDFIINED